MSAALRELASFHVSVALLLARLAPRPRAAAPASVSWLAVTALGIALGACALTARALVRHRRLLRRLESLPRVRGV